MGRMGGQETYGYPVNNRQPGVWEGIIVPLVGGFYSEFKPGLTAVLPNYPLLRQRK